MIAAAVQPQTETFQVGDYIAPTWSAGADRRGVVVKIFSKGKRTPEWWAEVLWLVGREKDGSTGTIAWRQLRLVWRPVVGATVQLQGDRRQKQQCEITKIHDTGELQLQPKSGHSFKVDLDAIAIPEQSTSFAESYEAEGQAIATSEASTTPEDDAAEAWAIAQVSALQAGAYVVSLVPVPGCDANAIFKIGMIDDDGAWLELVGDPEEGFDPVPLAALRLATDDEIAALKQEPELQDEPALQAKGDYIFGDNPILIDQATFDLFAKTYSADRLMENKIKDTFHWQEREFVCVGCTSSGELEAVEVVALDHWDRKTYNYDGLRGKDTFSYVGLVVECKRHRGSYSFVLTDRQIHLAVAPSESDTELKVDQQPTTNNQQPTTNNQQPTTNNQQPSIDTYEYTPIEPKPVWFSPNGDPVNQVEGQAIARNGKGNVRLVWGEGREADVPGQKVQWSRPEPTLEAGFQSVPLSLLTIDPQLQPRVLMDEPAIAEYQEAMIARTWDWAKDPIIAYWDGTTLWLSSGGHRCEGARRAGLQYISLEVRLGDRSEAVLNAPCANMQHGVRMTGADKNRAIGLILRDPKWQQESSRSLARMLTERGFRVDHKKIEGIRKGQAASGEMPQMQQRIVRRGNQTYTTAAPAVRQDQHSLEEVQALYAELGEFTINGDPAKPYKFECIGVLQRFKSLDEAYAKFGWMRERVAEKQKEYRTTCVDCAKRVNLSEGAEFECSALGSTHAVTDDPGASGCRHYRKRSWAADPAEPAGKPVAFAPFNPAIERPEPVVGSIISGYSAKDGEEDLQLTGAVVATDGDRLRLENGGIIYRDAAIVEPDLVKERTAAKVGLKQAIARWAAVNEGEWHETALEQALRAVVDLLTDFEF